MAVPEKRYRQLRRNATESEKRLWSILRNRQFGGCKFRRQHHFGPYILDFFCLPKKLAVEVDGDSHFVKKGPRKDAVRTAYLRSAGIEVIRFTNIDVLQHPQIVKQVLWKFSGSLTLTIYQRERGCSLRKTLHTPTRHQCVPQFSS